MRYAVIKYDYDKERYSSKLFETTIRAKNYINEILGDYVTFLFDIDDVVKDKSYCSKDSNYYVTSSKKNEYIVKKTIINSGYLFNEYVTSKVIKLNIIPIEDGIKYGTNKLEVGEVYDDVLVELCEAIEKRNIKNIQ